MAKKFTYTFTSDCPYTESKQSIQIDYLEVPILGTMSNGNRKDIYFCPNSDECPHLDQYGRCPVYLQAPESTY
jgi:hypothetical protein